MGRLSGIANLVAFDMGGTTASAVADQGWRAGRTTEYEFRDGISTPSRFIKAGGYMMRVPTVDVAEVGNGAGSIAPVDDGGLISRRPALGRRQPRPGLLRRRRRPPDGDRRQCGARLPARPAGRRQHGARSVDLAAAAIERACRRTARADADRGRAWACATIANANMVARHSRRHGGARRRSARLHAVRLRWLRARACLRPGRAASASAGRAAARTRRVHRDRACWTRRSSISSSAPSRTSLDGSTPAALRLAAVSLRDAGGRANCARKASTPTPFSFGFELDLRFAGQDVELQIASIPSPTTSAVDDLNARFLAAYEDMYGYVSSDGIESVDLRLRAHWPIAPAREAALRQHASAQPASAAVATRRPFRGRRRRRC